jgi:hypothetical protein
LDHEDSVFHKELEKIDRYKKMTQFEVSTWLKNEGKRLRMMGEIEEKEKAWGFRLENNQRVFDHKRSDLRSKFHERLEAAREKEQELFREKKMEEKVLSQKMKQFAENAERERKERRKKMEEQEMRETQKRKIAEQARQEKYQEELRLAQELLENLEKKSKCAQEKHSMSVGDKINRMKMRCDKVNERVEDYKRSEIVRKARVVEKISNKIVDAEWRQERTDVESIVQHGSRVEESAEETPEEAREEVN